MNTIYELRFVLQSSMKINKKHIEIVIHLIFWGLYFSSINVEWNSDWLDKSIRPKTPAPLIVLIFPIYFYLNAFWLVPKYLNKSTWWKYVLIAGLVFLTPELIRLLITHFTQDGMNFSKELFSRDSLLFGAPSVFFIAINTSFIYRFAKNWFSNQEKIHQLKEDLGQKKPATAYENVALLDEKEAIQMETALESYVQNQKPYLSPDLGLRDLAESIDTTEKKLSYLLNQKMEINFYDYINNYRIDSFLDAVKKEENKNLSLVGIALNCGFKSKSSFYRAFKTKTGQSPTQYLKS